MQTLVRRALVAAGPLLIAAPLLTASSAHADPGPAIDATCTFNAHGVFATPVDQGRTNLTLPDTLTMTGTVACVDSSGAPAAAGTFERTVTMPRTECTGDEHADTSTTAVRWTDGTTSTLTFHKIGVVKVAGTASLVVSGSVTPDSARFANDTVNAVGTSVGTGCGTPAGETALDSTLVLRLSR